jgi:hypothetical protein
MQKKLDLIKEIENLKEPEKESEHNSSDSDSSA